MLNLLIFMKTGHSMTLAHDGTMDSFLLQMLARQAIISDSGTWVPIVNISHILPQIAPQLPGEALNQIHSEGETRQ